MCSISRNSFDPDGYAAIADALRGSKLTSVNLLKNSISTACCEELAQAVEGKALSLSGLLGEETAVDFGGQQLGHEGTMLISLDLMHGVASRSATSVK